MALGDLEQVHRNVMAEVEVAMDRARSASDAGEAELGLADVYA